MAIGCYSLFSIDDHHNETALAPLGPIRLLPSIAAPTGFALLTLGTFPMLPLSPWTSAALAVPLWLLFVVLFDRRILNAARELAHAKSQAPDVQPPST